MNNEFEYKKLGDNIPDVSAVYFLMNNDELTYIGSTRHLKTRISNHKRIRNANIFIGDKKLIDDEFNGVLYFQVNHEPLRLMLEERYINEFHPKENLQKVVNKR